MEAHRFLHIKNYESNGYFDLWEKQAAVPGQDCDAICGLLNSILGKLDGEDGAFAQYSGHIRNFDILQKGAARGNSYGICRERD